MDADAEGGLEPTEAQVQADQQLALRTAWATLTGYATVVSPVGGAIATAATPMFEAIATFAVKKLGQRRVQHAAQTLLDAAQTADQPLADFIDQAVADDRRHELFACTLTIAQDTALRNKRRALGRALAAGIIGDDAKIDEELLFIRAVEDINEMHIRLLARMASNHNPPPGWSATAIREQDPGLADGVLALFGTLEAHGLIVRRMPGTRIVGPEQSYYLITQAGRRFIDRLADNSD